MKHLLKEATDLNSQLNKSEERAAQLKQDMTLKRALMGSKRKGVDNIDKYTGSFAENHNFTERTHTKKKLEDKFARRQC